MRESSACRDHRRRSFTTAPARGSTFDVPPGLVDPNIIPESGDPGTDHMLEIIAREQPVRPAAVLIPVVDHKEPTVLLTQRSRASQRACRPDRLSRRQDRCDRQIAARRRAARGRGGGRARPILRRSDRLSRRLRHRLRLPHPADGGAGEARLQAHHQPFRSRRRLRGAALLPDGSRPTTSCTARSFAAWSVRITRCRSRERYIWGATAGILRVSV